MHLLEGRVIVRLCSGLIAAWTLTYSLIAVAADYLAEPMPHGFRVELTELDGWVYADTHGKTLYTWPAHTLGGGEQPNAPLCIGPPCSQVWPAVLAAPDAKPIGKWTIIDRKDGSRQWAYDNLALYTSSLDQRPGDVLAGTSRISTWFQPAPRIPLRPRPDVPPGFTVASTRLGQTLVTASGAGWTVYTSDADSVAKSNCDANCTMRWKPLLAPQIAPARAGWSTFERAPGVRQWAYRGKPLYTFRGDRRFRDVLGSEQPGWRVAVIRPVAPPPPEFTAQETALGTVLADRRGKTLYLYNCFENQPDLLACDHPDHDQSARLAICGYGDAQKCLERWPPVIAPKNAKSRNRTWSIVEIDPHTGHYAAKGDRDALRVWAYRGRPVYTYVGDLEPGDTFGDGFGPVYGVRNGYIAFLLRLEYPAYAEY